MYERSHATCNKDLLYYVHARNGTRGPDQGPDGYSAFASALVVVFVVVFGSVAESSARLCGDREFEDDDMRSPWPLRPIMTIDADDTPLALDSSDDVVDDVVVNGGRRCVS